jgi:hypothetical protein
MTASEMLEAYWIEVSRWEGKYRWAKERGKIPPRPVPDPLIAPLVEEEYRHRLRVSELWGAINAASYPLPIEDGAQHEVHQQATEVRPHPQGVPGTHTAHS